MKRFPIILALFMAGVLTASAQLKVTEDGKVYIQKATLDGLAKLGVGDYSSTYLDEDDVDEYSLGIYSNSSQNYGLYYGSKCIGVFGESKYTNNSSSSYAAGILGLGKGTNSCRGFGVVGGIGSSSNGAGIYGSTYYEPSNISGAYAGYFNGATYVNGTITAINYQNLSDMRLKTNVTSLSNPQQAKGETLSKLLSLDVFSYNLNLPKIESFEKDKTVREKEAAAAEETSKQLHYGISAQELQKLYPDLVEEGQDGYLTVNYIEIVPLLIQGLREMSQQLNECTAELEEVKTRGSSSAVRNATTIGNGNILYQNTPNPFKEKTIIRFSLAADAQNASICIFDMSGKMLKKLPVSATETNVSINGYELGEGMFLYSLLVNGQEVDTKRMVITK